MCKRCEKLRPVVTAFADAMMRKLHANHDKGDRESWLDEGSTWLLDRAAEELSELYESRSVCGANPTATRRADVLAEAADVANFAMMVADQCGALKVKE